jgi:hypothetical protein
LLQRNNVLDAPASDTIGFLLRDICISSTQLKRLIWKIIAHLRLENPKLQVVFLEKQTYISQGSNVLDAEVYNIDLFL